MKISAKVLRVLTAEKISPEELQHMLTEAAFTSIRGCNLRYFHWLFLKRNEVLDDMQRVDLVEIGRGQNRMMEVHDPCNGDGCQACGWVGEVSRAVADTSIDKSPEWMLGYR